MCLAWIGWLAEVQEFCSRIVRCGGMPTLSPTQSEQTQGPSPILSKIFFEKNI
jgi:hypothetical protein